MQTSSEFLCAWVITLESFTRRVKAFEWHNELLLHAYKVSRSDPIMRSEIISRTSRAYGRWWFKNYLQILLWFASDKNYANFAAPENFSRFEQKPNLAGCQRRRSSPTFYSKNFFCKLNFKAIVRQSIGSSRVQSLPRFVLICLYLRGVQNGFSLEKEVLRVKRIGKKKAAKKFFLLLNSRELHQNNNEVLKTLRFISTACVICGAPSSSVLKRWAGICMMTRYLGPFMAFRETVNYISLFSSAFKASAG